MQNKKHGVNYIDPAATVHEMCDMCWWPKHNMIKLNRQSKCWQSAILQTLTS